MAGNFKDAIDAIKNSSKSSSVYIGADSQRYRTKDGGYKARYSAVIVLHIDSSRGGVIFHETMEIPDYGRKTESLVPRLLQETEFAIEAYEAVKDVLGDRHVEIHLDINTKDEYASSVAVSQALGYVKGVTGQDAFVKPNSWAAGHAADHAVRHMNQQ